MFGFDLALTEILVDGRHFFLVEADSSRGAEIAARLSAATESSL